MRHWGSWWLLMRHFWWYSKTHKTTKTHVLMVHSTTVLLLPAHLGLLLMLWVWVRPAGAGIVWTWTWGGVRLINGINWSSTIDSCTPELIIGRSHQSHDRTIATAAHSLLLPHYFILITTGLMRAHVHLMTWLTMTLTILILRSDINRLIDLDR